MKIRNKITGQIFEVVKGTLYSTKFFEELVDDIKVGEPKVEFEVEEIKEEPKKAEKKKAAKKTTKKSKKGAKKNATSK